MSKMREKISDAKDIIARNLRLPDVSRLGAVVVAVGIVEALSSIKRANALFVVKPPNTQVKDSLFNSISSNLANNIDAESVKNNFIVCVTNVKSQTYYDASALTVCARDGNLTAAMNKMSSLAPELKRTADHIYQHTNFSFGDGPSEIYLNLTQIFESLTDSLSSFGKNLISNSTGMLYGLSHNAMHYAAAYAHEIGRLFH